MLNTFELGPHLQTTAPAFTIRDHWRKPHSVESMMGPRGLLLGFVTDMWQPTSIQRVLWLQRHAHTLIRAGVNIGLIICDKPDTLYGFYHSSPFPPEFPLLADVNGEVMRRYNLDQHPGLVLIDPTAVIRHKWLLPDERVWPKIVEIMHTVETI